MDCEIVKDYTKKFIPDGFQSMSIFNEDIGKLHGDTNVFPRVHGMPLHLIEVIVRSKYND